MGGELKSVHLEKFPVADASFINEDLEERMAIAQKITSMVLALRRKVNIKVRQPLQQIMIPAVDEEQRKHIEAVKELIISEVNVKDLLFAEGQGILVKKVKCNFRVMGKKFGKAMKGVAAHLDALSQEEIAQLEKTGTYAFELDGLADGDLAVTTEGNFSVAANGENCRRANARERAFHWGKHSGRMSPARLLVSV